MPSASITPRKTKRGGRPYAVRLRLGGRAYPVEHGGSFPTMREARIRRDLIAGELAAGRNPKDLLRTLTEQPKTDQELHGLVYGMEIKDRSEVAKHPWYRSPVALGGGVLVLNAALYVAVYAV